MAAAVDSHEPGVPNRQPVASFDVVERFFGFEVREYAGSVQARTTVRGGFRENAAEGLRVLANYLYGGNRAPDGSSITLPMTTPVGQIDRGAATVVAVTLPAGWTRATLPRPVDPRVSLVEVPAGRWAALPFPGRATPEAAAARALELRDLVRAAGLVAIGEVVLAQYDPPWTLPGARHNEALVAVE